MKKKYFILFFIICITILFWFLFGYQTEFHKRMHVTTWSFINFKSYFLDWEEKAQLLFNYKIKEPIWFLDEKKVLELYEFYTYIISLAPNNVEYYIKAMLHLDLSNDRYFRWTNQWKKLSLQLLQKFQDKSLNQFCNINNFQDIFEIDSYQKLLTYWLNTPICSDYQVPYYIWYNNFVYSENLKWAINMYKIAMASKNTDEKNLDKYNNIHNLLAIIESKYKGPQRGYSAYLEIYKMEEDKSKSCNNFYRFLSENWDISEDNFDWKNVKLINTNRNKMLWKFKNNFGNCSDYLNRMVRMINLSYLNEANNNYKKDNNENFKILTPEELYEKWYIDFIPLDYHQDEKFWNWIVYFYNIEIWAYDWEMKFIDNK